MTDETRTELPERVTSEDGLRQLAAYLEGARWFGGKGRSLRVMGVRRLGVVAEDGPRVVVDLVEVAYDDAAEAGEVELYQLPLSLYTDPVHRLDHAFVGWWEDPELGWVHAYDAVHDRDAMAAYLRAFAFPPDGPISFHRLPGDELDATAASTPFTGEQSNSSVAFGEQALLKIFRRVTPGSNPDIEIHERLTRAGSDNVAALYGWVECAGVSTGSTTENSPTTESRSTTGVSTGSTTESSPTTERTTTGDGVLQLGMLQQFLRTASDGWELALTSVRNLFAEADLYADEVGGDFAAEAQRLGEAVANIHRLLAEHFPTAERSGSDHADLGEAMTRRLEAAIAVVPELSSVEARLRELFSAVSSVGSGPVQRVHGDLHLGQTLRTSKGWKIVDFEGEPAKPLRERALPDSRWRDVAGMLRSFDYAPRVAALTAGTTDDEGREQRAFRAAEWSARNQAAFLDAYTGHRDLTGADRTLLAAYVADKAVYECVYEARNRPGWLAIPMAALTTDSEASR